MCTQTRHRLTCYRLTVAELGSLVDALAGRGPTITIIDMVEPAEQSSHVLYWLHVRLGGRHLIIRVAPEATYRTAYLTLAQSQARMGEITFGAAY